MAGMCPQYPVYWCPLENGCPGTPNEGEEVPYCIIAHNAASSAVVASARIGIPPPRMAVDFLKAEASSLWGMTEPNSR